MRPSPGTVAAGIVGVALAVLVVRPVHVAAVHDPDISDDESKCQIGTSLAQGKFVTEKAKCIIKCNQGARKGNNPSTDCDPPYAGATATCVDLAENKAIGLEGSKCEKDCPECYAGGDCAADASTRTAATEAQVDGLRALVYCDDAGSGDGLNADEAKCQDTTARVLSNFVAKKLKCLSKCRKDEHKGKVAPGSCDPPPSAMKAADCISKNTDKAQKLIDKKCEAAQGGDKPECYGTDTGADWVARGEDAVDSRDADLYCGSPSGAFLD
jgi:hypothetical protein